MKYELYGIVSKTNFIDFEAWLMDQNLKINVILFPDKFRLYFFGSSSICSWFILTHKWQYDSLSYILQITNKQTKKMKIKKISTTRKFLSWLSELWISIWCFSSFSKRTRKHCFIFKNCRLSCLDESFWIWNNTVLFLLNMNSI